MQVGIGTKAWRQSFTFDLHRNFRHGLDEAKNERMVDTDVNSRFVLISAFSDSAGNNRHLTKKFCINRKVVGSNPGAGKEKSILLWTLIRPIYLAISNFGHNPKLSFFKGDIARS